MYGCISAALCVFVAGCGGNSSNNDSKNNAVVEIEGSINEVSSDTSILDMEESLLNLDDYSLDYIFGTDSQPQYKWTSIAKAESGYYYWSPQTQMLMYYDISSESGVPVCNKPNCTHMDEDCNAFFNANALSGLIYDRSYIQYYDGYVYVIGYNEEGYVYLYQVSADGSVCKEYMELFKADLTSPDDDTDSFWRAPYVCIHRGYVYFIDNRESVPKIRAAKLGSDDIQIVFENSGDRPNLYRMEAYGDYLFFQTGNFTNDDYVDIDAGIFALNVNTNEVSLVKKGAINSYVIYEDAIYYSTASGINCYLLKTGEDTTVIDGGNTYEDVQVVDEHIYCFNGDTCTLTQYDMSGNMISQISDDTLIGCYMGDEDYFFAAGKKVTDDSSELKLLPVKNLSQNDVKWISIMD